MRVGQADLSDAYRRDARRLRARLHDHPQELQRSLRDLAARSDQFYSQKPAAPISEIHPFLPAVTSELRSGLLTYTRRLDLIRSAQKFGISRFQANLIIAAVQHRMNDGAIQPTTCPRASTKLLPLLLILLMQCCILLGTFILLR